MFARQSDPSRPLTSLPRTAFWRLALFLSLWLVACSGPSDAGPGDSAASASAADGGATTEAVEAGSRGFPPIPELAEGASLPRTYAGLTLGDPPPPGGEKSDKAPAFYPEAEQYLLRISENPRIIVAAMTHDGTIFRIEWRTRNTSLDRDDVADAFAEVLGPAEESKWLPDHVTNWNDGLSEGDTGIDVFRRPGSEWLYSAVYDVGRSNELLSLGRD